MFENFEASDVVLECRIVTKVRIIIRCVTSDCTATLYTVLHTVQQDNSYGP